MSLSTYIGDGQERLKIKGNERVLIMETKRRADRRT